MKLPRCVTYIYLIVGCIMLAGTKAPAFWASQRPVLPNFDERTGGAGLAAAAAEHGAAVRALRARLPDVRVDFDEHTGTPSWVLAERGLLTGPGGQGRAVSATAAAAFGAGEDHRPTKAFLHEHRALFGFGPEVLPLARLKQDAVTAHNGLRTVVWEQELDGIPVFEGLLISHTTKDGELVNVSSHFIPNVDRAAEAGTPNRAALVKQPPIPAARAVTLAVRNLEETLSEADVTDVDARAEGAEQDQHFTAPQLNGAADVELVWLPINEQSLRLCWSVELTSRARGEMFRLLVDAQTGAVLVRHCLTDYLSDAAYRVYTSDSPSPFSPGNPTPSTYQPPLGSRSLVVTPALNTNASPLGWIDDGGNETRGNNVDAHTDLDANDVADLPRPQGSPARTFDFTLDLTQAPATYTNASVVQLFYWCNWMHDKLYELGFTEAARNFQSNNFGRGGLGSDAVQADSQDGSGVNNANFSTPSDGSPGRMQMYVFTGPTPDRDGDLDAEIVLHEYTHGLSNRRVGGGVGISALQSGGMGEGWSDWYGLTLLSESGDDVNGCYAAGGYATYLFSGLTTNYYFGIRRYPYCTDMSRNPLTFKDIDTSQASSHAGVPRSPVIGTTANEVHNQGEVWCMTLWEARANLIGKYGWAVGNQLILRLVTDGMNLSPANPNFLQARDAILQADVVYNGGADLGELWAAFAKRGMGRSATSPSSSTTTGVFEAYDVPDSLTVSPQTGFTSSGPVAGPFTQTSLSFQLINTGTNSVTWNSSRTAAWLNLTPGSGTIPIASSNAVTAALDPSAYTLVAGIYTNTVRFTNVTSGVAHTRVFILRVGQPDYYTELFDGGDNDLDFQTLTFTPDGSTNFYSVCREVATNFPTDPLTGTNLALGNDTYLSLTLPAGTNISIYGQAANVFYIGSPGYITLSSGDATVTPSLANHFRLPRVAALSSHLHPTEGGTVSWQQLSNRVAVTFRNLHEYATSNTNNFQIELFFDGRIRMTHLSLGTTTGLAGLSAGNGVPAGFVESDLSTYGPCALPMIVSAPASATEGDGVLSGQGRVSLFSPALTNVAVNLTSSDSSEVAVPSTATILAGQTNVAFDLTILDDAELDGVQLANITATAAGYSPATVTMQVIDNETATLNVLAPLVVTEGNVPVLGTVQASAAPSANITVSLASSDPTEIQVPPTVILPAGQTSAVFTITIVNDTAIDGDQTATITAHVPNWTDGSTNILVHDNEPTNLVVTLPASAREGNGTLLSAGTVRIGGTLTSNLLVTLLSSDLTELLVPPVATIPAGQTSATFDLTIVDDPDIDSSQVVTVTASAMGFASGSMNMTVTDDESPFEPFSPSPAHLATNVIQTADLSWLSGAVPGEVITNDVYFGTNPTPGAAELQGSTTDTNWSLPNLYPQTTYYWQIVARKAGVTPGPVWQFTTRGVDHFVWDAIPSPQSVSAPFNVTITAKDPFETTVSNFTQNVNLGAMAGGIPTTNRMLDGVAPYSSSSGTYTLGYSFTPTNDLTVTHVRHYFGSKVSIWNAAGTLLVSQLVSGTLAVWNETTLPVPITLVKGSNYVVAAYVPGTTYYYTNATTMGFPNGTINQGLYSTADAFPTTITSLFWPLVGLRYTLGANQLITIAPVTSGNFVSGSWTGNLAALQPATNIVLRADDGNGHTGTSLPFAVQLQNDVGLTLTDSPDPVSLGANLTYTVTVTNIGPLPATGVVVSNLLPAGVALVSVTPSQGSTATNGNSLVSNLGSLGGNTSATITIVATAMSVGTLTNQASVSRAEADPYLLNNSASATTSVQTPVLTINDVSLYEGNSGTTNAVFTVTVWPAPALPTMVNFATANSSAVAPGDFISTNGTLNFAPGETNKSVFVTIIGDTSYEANESFTVNLSAATNATIADSQGIGTILNDDPMPTLSIGDAALREGNSGTTNAVFPVTLSAPSGLATTFYYATAGGSATSGSDFVANSGSITLPAGVTSTNVTVSVIGDIQIENDEVFYVDLSSVVNAILFQREAACLILNDDGLPGDLDHFSWSTIPSPQAVGQPFAVTINALDAFNSPAVNFTGVASLDGLVGLPATNVLGSASTTYSFPIYTGYYAERTQVIYPASELGGAGRITALALNVSSLPGISLNNWTVRIRPTGLSSYTSYVWESTNWTVVAQTNLTITSSGWALIPLNAPYDYNGTDNLMFDFSFYNSTTYGSGSCWVSAQTSIRTLYFYSSSYGSPLTWSGTSPSAYTASYTPNLQLIRAGAAQPLLPALTGSFTNANWSGNLAVLAPATNLVLRAKDALGHTGTSNPFDVSYQNDISLQMTETPDPVAVGGYITYTLTVTNVGPTSATAVTVTNWLPASTLLVSATASQGSTLTNAAQVVCNLGTLDANASATVLIVAQTAAPGTLTNLATAYRSEPDALLSNNSAQTITTVQIPALSINNVSVLESAGSTPAVFTVSLLPPAVTNVSVSFATADGTALAGSDYAATNGTLIFAPGQTNQAVSILVLDDTAFEPVETFFLVLSNAVNAALAIPQGTAFIVDNEGPPEFQIVNLLTNNSRIVDHDSLTGDDRGGVAISTTGAFVTGDVATARFAATDLSGGTSLGVIRDSLCTDLRTETVYLLGNGSIPLTSAGGTVTSLIELNATGSPTGVLIPLSQSFTMPSSANGIFSGYGRIVVHNGTRVYDIYVPTGLVTDRGLMTRPNMYASESWASWGVAEYFGGDLYLAFRESSTQRIVRARVPDGSVTAIATFSNLSDMASFVVSPSRNRWYFHYESSGQFGGLNETFGYADAQFGYVSTNPPVILTQPVSQTVPLAGTASFNVSAISSSLLSYQWRKNGSNLVDTATISGSTSNRLTLTNVQTNDGGLYSVMIANPYGSTLSSNATLTVDVPQLPAVPANPDPTNFASGVSVHTLLSWTGSSFSESQPGQAVNGTYGVIDTSGYDSEALSYLQGLPGLTGSSVSWAAINAGSGPALLAAYDVIYLSVNAGSSDYLSLRTAVAAGNPLERYVYLGGTLVLNLAGNAGSQADIGPGGLSYDRTLTHDTASIVAPTHPFITGAGYGGSALTSAMFANWGNTDHGSLTNLPGGATQLLRNPDGTSMIEYPWGAGHVIASTLTFGWSGSTIRFGSPFTNELLYAAAANATAPTQYHVFLGTNLASLPLIAANLTSNVCNPGPLAFNTTYYWRVVASNAVGSVTGAVWQLTTTLDEVRFAAATQSVSEGAGVATIAVVRENPAGGMLNIQYATTNGTATAGLDYTAVSGMLQIPAGVLTTNFQVPILEDALNEGYETVLLQLSQPPANVLLAAPSNAVLSITDNDVVVVAVFDNPLYVDTGNTTSSESDNVQASLTNRGCLVVTFTNILTTAASNSVLLIPEQEVAALGPALSGAERSALSNFVAAGGLLIVHGCPANTRATDLLNRVFGYSLQESLQNVGVVFNRTDQAAETSFTNAPANLAALDGSEAILTPTLPSGARSIYETNTQSLVAEMYFGNGTIIFLGWDWYNAAPRGTQDSGWLTVLENAVWERGALGQPPSILTQPVSQSLTVGGAASFTVTASGSSPLFYQWRKDGLGLQDSGRISGTTTNLLTITSLLSNDAGNYTVLVTNAYGSATSSVASLTISTNLQIVVGIYSAGDASERAAISTSLTNLGFDVRYVGQGQWTGLNAVVSYPGVSSFGPSLSEISSGVSYVQISDHGSDWTPNSYSTLADNTAVTVALDTAHPLTAGLPASWTTLGFWRYGSVGNDFLGWSIDTNLPSLVQETSPAIQDRLLVASTLGTGHAVYIGWNVYGPDAGTNDLAVLRNSILWAAGQALGSPPVITSHPQNQAALLGGTVSFTVGVTGSSPWFCQWRKGASPLSGETNAALTLLNVRTNDAGAYCVVISNLFGTVTSSNAMLLVVPPPVIGGDTRISTNGQFEFTVRSQPGTMVVIEASTNLVQWTPVHTNLVDSTGAFLFRELRTAAYLRCFYRARLFQGALPPPVIQPQMQSSGFKTGRFGFNVGGVGGLRVVIEASTNLVNWSSLQTNTLGVGPLYFSDPNSASFAQRYYRARVVP